MTIYNELNPRVELREWNIRNGKISGVIWYDVAGDFGVGERHTFFIMEDRDYDDHHILIVRYRRGDDAFFVRVELKYKE